MLGKLNFKVKVNKKVLGTEIANSSLQSRCENALLDFGVYLESLTPVGATGNLKRSLDVGLKQVLIGSSIQFIGEIAYRDPLAKQKTVGRGPGLAPPLQPIQDWVTAKGSLNPIRDAHRVRRKIAKYGTERWRKNDNWVGLNRDGSIKPSSPLMRLKEYFRKRV